MVKKLIGIALVLGVLGGILAGCAPKEEAPANPPATTATTTGTTG